MEIPGHSTESLAEAALPHRRRRRQAVPEPSPGWPGHPDVPPHRRSRRKGVAGTAPPSGQSTSPAPAGATFAPSAPAARHSQGPTAAGAVSLLTGREIEVLRLVSTGLSNRAAAAHPLVDVRTVESHLTNMSRKLGLTRRALIATARDVVSALPTTGATATSALA